MWAIEHIRLLPSPTMQALYWRLGKPKTGKPGSNRDFGKPRGKTGVEPRFPNSRFDPEFRAYRRVMTGE